MEADPALRTTTCQQHTARWRCVCVHVLGGSVRWITPQHGVGASHVTCREIDELYLVRVSTLSLTQLRIF